MNKFFPYLFIFTVVLIFFWQFITKGLLPIPSDTIIGLYHPYRDFYAKNYPNGIPYKNFLITDPVRQQIPWKNISILMEKQFQLPLWNPYNFSGTPLMANFQSAVFYPLNIFFFILSFNLAWSIFILSQPLLTAIFMYLYLKNLKASKEASILGAITFAFSGFSIAWMEWGNIIHTVLWLPLMLFSVDKIFKARNKKWVFIFTLSLSFSFLAGHLQIFFYSFAVVLLYILARLTQTKDKKAIFSFLIGVLLFLIITFPQTLSTFQLISLSGRGLDQNFIQNPGWFIPWQNLIQFLFPDFFGNPATLNYWGVWNYGEFIGYVGIFPLLMAIYSFFRKDKKTLFFGLLFFASLIFALPTFLAKIPFNLNVPIISSSQPTRFLAITDFSLAILASLGLDFFLKKKKNILYPLGFISIIFIFIWIFILFFAKVFISLPQIAVSKSNLIFPSLIFIAVLFLTTFFVFLKRKKWEKIVYALLIIITLADLFRFGWKFLPFTDKKYLFPNTLSTSFLKEQEKPFRVIVLSPELFPPNFSVLYGIESLDGYDPLYLRRYAELVAAIERGRPDIAPPFGFNRIITPRNYSSKLIDLFNVKYVMSLNDLNDKNLEKVFEEGRTKIYQNKKFLPRVFFVRNVISVSGKQNVINKMFKIDDFKTIAVVEENISKDTFSVGQAKILSFDNNGIKIETENKGEGFLFISNSYYPTWRAKIDNQEKEILLTNFNFQGLMVPSGKHIIVFYHSLL